MPLLLCAVYCDGIAVRFPPHPHWYFSFFLFCFQGERGLPGLKGETVSETFSENVTSRVHFFFFFLTPSYLVMFRETQERMEHLANPGRQW